MKRNKWKTSVIFSVLLLTLILGLCGCGKDTKDVEAARRSMENREAKELRDKFADDSVTEVVVEEDITVMGCLVVKGNKTISGTGKIILDPAAQAGIYQDIKAFEDGKTIAKEDLESMMESSVLYVKNGSELTLSGDVVIDSNKAGNGVVVEKGGKVVISGKAALQNGHYCNLYNEGTISVEGGTFEAANGYNIINDGTLTVTKGSMDASACLGNIYNLDALKVSGGVIAKAKEHNIYVAKGSAIFEGGTVSSGKKTNVYVGSDAKTEMKKGASIQGGTVGILSYGKLELENAKLENNLTNIRNFGKADIHDSEILKASVDSILNEKGGSVTLNDTNITGSGARAIANNEGTVNFKTLGVRRSGGDAVCNYGGTITGEDIVIYGSSGVALKNKDTKAGLGGNIKIKKVEIQTGAGINIVQESFGRMELTDVISGITSVTNIKLISGTLALNNVEIQGSTSTGAGIWTIGGKLEVNDAVIKSTKGRGMALAGGEITGKNILIEDVVNTGIDVMQHDNGYSSAKVELSNVTFNNIKRDNVATTGKHADITINGGKFGKSFGNNVRAKEGVMTLNDVDILGNQLGQEGNVNYHGVYMAGGVVHLNNCTIRDPLACAIRNKGGNLYATNLTTYNTPAAAVTNAAGDDGTVGNITINGLVTNNAALGALKNECAGTFTVKNGTLNESQANIVMVKEGKMFLENVEVCRSINSDNSNHHNTYITGGTLEMKSVMLKDADSSGIRQTGGTVIGDKVTIKNASVNDVNVSKGTTILKNSTLEVSTRTSVNLTGAGVSAVLSNVMVKGAGDLKGNNVNCIYVAPGAKITLNEGTTVTGSATRAGVLVEGGSLEIDKAEIYGNATRGITLTRKTETDKDTKKQTVYEPYTTICNASIHHNGNATVSGGAVYNEGYAYIKDSVFNGNTANTGGAVNCSTTSITFLENVTIKNNKATDIGGGIHVTAGATMTVLGGNIVSNTAVNKGNGIRVNSNNFNMRNAAVVDKNNNIYLEKGITIKTKENGIGNTAKNPLMLTCASTQVGTYVIESDTEAYAEYLEDKVDCYDTEGKKLESSPFEKNIVLGTGDEVAWTARVLDEDGTYTKYLSLQEAINAVPKNGKLTRVEVMRDVVLSSAIDIAEKSNRNILLTDDGNGPYTIGRGFTGERMIILRTGNELTIAGTSGDDENPSLIFDGGKLAAGKNQQIITVGTTTTNCHATLTIESGVKFTNNNNTNGGGAIIVYGTLNMNGGRITDNTSKDSGGAIFVHVTGNANISGGMISNNQAASKGGAIYQYKTNAGEGTITMTGGTVSGNTASGGGDDVYVQGIMNMSAEAYVGNVYLEAGNTLNLTASLSEREIQTEVLLPSYVVGTKVLSGNAAIVAGNYQYFKIPDGKGVEIDETGCLAINGEEVEYEAQILRADGTYKGYPTLSEALAAVPTNGTLTRVEVMKDITLTAALDIPQDKNRNILLTDDGNGPYTITRDFTKLPMVILRTGNQMTVEGSSKNDKAVSLIFDGAGLAPANDQSIIKVGTSATNSKATLTLNAGVKLMNNKSSQLGAGVRTFGIFNMNGGVIEKNESSAQGGGIAIEKTGKMYMKGGMISNNKSTKEGGGIVIYGNGALTMEDGTITGNKGTAGAGICAICGSAAERATININGGTITDNIGTGNGGAIFAHANTVLTMTGGTVNGNRGVHGGAVYLHNNATYGAATMRLTGGTISGNTATGNGGGVAMANANNLLTMTGGTISDNTAATNGKDVYVQGSFNMEGEAYAGSVYLLTGKTVNLKATLSKREVQTEIVLPTYAAGTKVLSGDQTIVAGNYQYFKVPDGKGVEIDKTGSLAGVAEEVEYEARILQANGSYKGYLTLAEALAAVPTDGTQTKVEIMRDITLTAALDIPQDKNQNILLTDDGKGPYTITRAVTKIPMIILRTGNQMTIEGSSKDDKAPSLILDGAGLAAAADQHIIKIGTSTTNSKAALTLNPGVKLTNNKCTNVGSAIRVYGILNMNGSVIDGNEDTTQGGAIAIETTGQMYMKGGTISNNKSTKEGGAVLISDNGSLTMDGGTITGNKGTAGAAICGMCGSNLKGSAKITVNGGTISDNTGTGNGGAIFVHANGVLTMTGGTISGNKGAHGGAVYLHYNASLGAGAKIEMSGGTISGNTASGNGGGVAMANANNSLTMTGGTISDNTAATNGVDVYVPGTLNMAGEAYVGSVYLTAGKTVNLTAALSKRENLTEVVLPSYTEGTKVLAGAEDIVAGNYQCFIPASKDYDINAGGKLEVKTQILAVLRTLVKGILK